MFPRMSLGHNTKAGEVIFCSFSQRIACSPGFGLTHAFTILYFYFPSDVEEQTG
jgi:hypothetical protein